MHTRVRAHTHRANIGKGKNLQLVSESFNQSEPFEAQHC